MNDITLTSWIANIPNTSVSACFNSGATLPSSISPSEALHQVALGYRKGQEQINTGSTGPLFLGVASPVVFGTGVLKDDIGDYRTVTHRFTVRQYLDPDNVRANSGTTII